MKIKLLAPFDGGYGTIWLAGATLEMDDSYANGLIANGTAKQMPDNTPARLDPTGYVGCNPPNEAPSPAPLGVLSNETDAQTRSDLPPPIETKGPKNQGKA